MNNLHESIYATHTTVKHIVGDTKENIKAFDNNNNEINLDWSLIENYSNNNKWFYQRIAEYPTHEDCIHALLDGGDTLTELQAKRQQIKDKYPKG
jgi:hypothetical protein